MCSILIWYLIYPDKIHIVFSFKIITQMIKFVIHKKYKLINVFYVCKLQIFHNIISLKYLTCGSFGNHIRFRQCKSVLRHHLFFIEKGRKIKWGGGYADFVTTLYIQAVPQTTSRTKPNWEFDLIRDSAYITHIFHHCTITFYYRPHKKILSAFMRRYIFASSEGIFISSEFFSIYVFTYSKKSRF